MHWLDVTVPIRTGMAVYEGDPPVLVSRVSAMADGAVCNVSRLDFGVHTGTHVDAPVHFIEGAPGVEGIAPGVMMGPAYVVDATALTEGVTAAALRLLTIPEGVERLIFKTADARLWERPDSARVFVGLAEDAARLLVDRGVRLVGVDCPSIAAADDPAPAHRALLAANVVILEGLDLRAVAPGLYELACLPLLIPGADGAPARVLLGH